MIKTPLDIPLEIEGVVLGWKEWSQNDQVPLSMSGWSPISADELPDADVDLLVESGSTINPVSSYIRYKTMYLMKRKPSEEEKIFKPYMDKIPDQPVLKKEIFYILEEKERKKFKSTLMQVIIDIHTHRSGLSFVKDSLLDMIVALNELSPILREEGDEDDEDQDTEFFAPTSKWTRGGE